MSRERNSRVQLHKEICCYPRILRGRGGIWEWTAVTPPVWLGEAGWGPVPDIWGNRRSRHLLASFVCSFVFFFILNTLSLQWWEQRAWLFPFQIHVASNQMCSLFLTVCLCKVCRRNVYGERMKVNSYLEYKLLGLKPKFCVFLQKINDFSELHWEILYQVIAMKDYIWVSTL